jgi:type I restriction-modification system DNA methylase subunit
MARGKTSKANSSANIGFEAKRWLPEHFYFLLLTFNFSDGSDWFRKDDDVRWQYGVPPRGNANFAWVQHFIHHLAPAAPGSSGGMAGFVLVRFCLWMKHGCHRTRSREETGSAFSAIHKACAFRPPVRALP